MNTDIKTKVHVAKIFDNDLAPIHKSEVTLTLIKTAYVGMDIIDLSNVLML